MVSGIVSQIFIYPIKSLGGFSVQQAKVLCKGLEHDRRWMLIDESNRFLTQREHPVLALFSTCLHAADDSLLVTFQKQTITIPLWASGQLSVAKIWDNEVDVIEVSSEISNWFSKVLQQPVRLVFFPEVNARPVDPAYALHAENQTSLSDGYPILLVGQSSLDDLNSKLGQAVSMDRFRPNIVFTGGEPYEEDSWKKFEIGESALAAVKPCARCVVTTIDQQTALTAKEPLYTLSRYRKVGNKVLFGQNLIPFKEGNIQVGDQITLL